MVLKYIFLIKITFIYLNKTIEVVFLQGRRGKEKTGKRERKEKKIEEFLRSPTPPPPLSHTKKSKLPVNRSCSETSDVNRKLLFNCPNAK